MSDYKRKIGQVEKIDLKGLTVEEWCESRCKELGLVKESWHNSYESLYKDKADESHVISKDTVWKVTANMDSSPYNDLFIVYPLNDSTYRYITQYHNSCASLWEMLEDNLYDLKDTVCMKQI